MLNRAPTAVELPVVTLEATGMSVSSPLPFLTLPALFPPFLLWCHSSHIGVVVETPWHQPPCSHLYETAGSRMDFPGGSDDKESVYNAGDESSIPGSGRSPGGGHGNLLQCSCLENPMHREAWRATVHGVAQSWTWLSC